MTTATAPFTRREGPKIVHWPSHLFAGVHLIGGLFVIGRAVLWRDEMATFQFASLSPTDLLHATSHVDRVLFPYYAFMHAWGAIFGLNAVSLRLPSLLAGAVTIWCTCELARKYWGFWPSIIAGATLALNSSILYFSLEARPYAMVIALITLSLLIVGSDQSKGDSHWRAPATYTLVVSAAISLNLFAIFALPAAITLVLQARKFPLRWAIAFLVSTIVGASVVAISIGQRGQAEAAAPPDLRLAIGSFRDSIGMGRWLALILAVAVVATIASQLRLRSIDIPWLAALLLVITPTTGIYILSLKFDLAFRTRYAVVIIVGCALLIASATAHISALTMKPRDRLVTRHQHSDTQHRRTPGVVTILSLTLVATISVGLHKSTAMSRAKFGDNYVALTFALESRLAVGDVIAIPNSYGAGGRAMGIAYHDHDNDFISNILTALPRGGEPDAYFRKVTSVSSSGVDTVADPDPLEGTVWSIDASWTAENPTDADRALSACTRTGPSEQIDADLIISRFDCTDRKAHA